MNKTSLAVLLILVLLVSGTAYYFTSVKPVGGMLKYGLDLRGGVRVVLEAKDTPDHKVTKEDLQKAVATVRERVDRLGVTEPVIQTEVEKKRIIVELPGVTEAESARQLIGKTALLEFVDPQGNVVVTGKNLKANAAKAMIDSRNRVVVTLEFDGEGAKKFAEATTANVGKIIEIRLDGEPISTPVVDEPITDGSAIIQGSFDLEEAQKLATLLNSGSLPVPLEELSSDTVTPTLGKDSLDKSTRAGIIGIIAVVAFMLIAYRLSGLVANFALVIYAMIVIGVLAGINAILTLPGIAGIVLSIGMAVDANVISFERVKEELRLGKTVRSAIEAGFTRAFITILDSNVTTIIAAAVLFYYGTGPVRGFAVTLTIGILSSMLTAVVITRFILRHMVSAGLIKNTKLFFGA